MCDGPSSPGGGGGSAPACNPAVQSCRCCTRLTIKEITFSGNNIVEKDTTGNFPSPEWLDSRADADQSPIAYARNKHISMSAKFSVSTAPCLASESVEIKGQATFGSATLTWTGSVSVSSGDTEVTASLTSNNPLPNAVGIFESSAITWQSNACGNGWNAAGTSKNILYVTLGDPSGSPSYWTLLDISCRGAAGAATEDDFVKKSFDPYRSKTGNGNGFRRKRDGTELTYYKMGGGTPSTGVFTCSDLLSRADGTGRCGAWARFLVAMHQVHGVTSSAVFGVVPVSAPVLIVKNCNFVGAGTLSVPFTHVGQTECVKQTGIFGQGKNNPQFIFGDHALVKHSTGIYDPSYGVGPVANEKIWEDGGIVGLGTSSFTPFTFDGDSQFISNACSPGFILHVAVAGDTIASIAATFGVASTAALLAHRYNAGFAALGRPAGTINPGDALFIPRALTTARILKNR